LCLIICPILSPIFGLFLSLFICSLILTFLSTLVLERFYRQLGRDLRIFVRVYQIKNHAGIFIGSLDVCESGSPIKLILGLCWILSIY
jgi:hypothetical protein